ncbi:hypothetical protein [Flavonifractor sp. AGMB03687]|uniref:hypothetical protein n=1 Tax=Flavonifractor sp. AGMB03687 TaxID=2785133 RepID=UPI001ADF7359|nr:hypothetical protein [Flavonifractor sp. AGMB03687]
MKPTMKKVPVMLTTIALAGQLTLPAVAATPLAPRSYEGSINITEAFRDQKLQSWLLNAANLGGAGADGVLTQEERMAVTQLDLSGLGLTSLEGLGAFPNLQSLNCSNNNLEQLLLTDNTKLVFIETFDNRLTSIDVSMLPELTFLHIDHNRLTHLDMSYNTKLEGGGFVARNNFMEEIKLPNQPGLTVYLDDYEEQDPIEGHDRAA